MTPLTYTVRELAEVLSISRSAAYQLIHRADFPAFRIGKRWLVERSKFEDWLHQQSA